MSTLQLPDAISITPVGSRVTCRPAPAGTDRDWLVLIARDTEARLMQYLSEEQWDLGGSLADEENETEECDKFMSFTKGVDNIIVTSSPLFHRRFIAATSIAKRLNLMDKADRIALFQAVLYANECDSAWCFAHAEAEVA